MKTNSPPRFFPEISLSFFPGFLTFPFFLSHFSSSRFPYAFLLSPFFPEICVFISFRLFSAKFPCLFFFRSSITWTENNLRVFPLMLFSIYLLQHTHLSHIYLSIPCITHLLHRFLNSYILRFPCIPLFYPPSVHGLFSMYKYQRLYNTHLLLLFLKLYLSIFLIRRGARIQLTHSLHLQFAFIFSSSREILAYLRSIPNVPPFCSFIVLCCIPLPPPATSIRHEFCFTHQTHRVLPWRLPRHGKLAPTAFILSLRHWRGMSLCLRGCVGQVWCFY